MDWSKHSMKAQRRIPGLLPIEGKFNIIKTPNISQHIPLDLSSTGVERQVNWTTCQSFYQSDAVHPSLGVHAYSHTTTSVIQYQQVNFQNVSSVVANDTQSAVYIRSSEDPRVYFGTSPKEQTLYSSNESLVYRNEEPDQSLFDRDLARKREKIWNRRSFQSSLSIESDSSGIESEREFERRDSVQSVDTRESVSSLDNQDYFSTDTETERDCSAADLNDDSSCISPSTKKQALSFPSIKAEIIDAADLQNELLTNNQGDDDENNSTLGIVDTENYIEELFRVGVDIQDAHRPQPNIKEIKNADVINASIQSVATSYIAQIRECRETSPSKSGIDIKPRLKKNRKFCGKCHEFFSTDAALLHHLMTHSSRNPGERLIKCPICHKRFSSVCVLERHLQKFHTGEMKFVCEICKTPFKFRTHLMKHLASSKCRLPQNKPKLTSPKAEQATNLVHPSKIESPTTLKAKSATSRKKSK